MESTRCRTTRAVRVVAEIRTSKNPSTARCCDYMALVEPGHAVLFSVAQRASASNMPVAIVPADEEALVSNEATYELAALIPDCTIIKPGTGCYHEIWVEDDATLLLHVCQQLQEGFRGAVGSTCR